MSVTGRTPPPYIARSAYSGSTAWWASVQLEVMNVRERCCLPYPTRTGPFFPSYALPSPSKPLIRGFFQSQVRQKRVHQGSLGEQLKNAGELLELVRSLIEDCLFPLFCLT